jgi:geranylgeranyl pyrophosphate synthase
VKKFLQPNIGKTGRLIRAGIGIGFLVAAVAAYRLHWLASFGFAVGGLFCLFEATRGWCVARACGIKTRW